MTRRNYPTYSVAIRTLGKAGNIYVRMIQSLKRQTIPAEKILVYLAEGYPRPDSVCDEEYIICPKGMASQRALSFSEIRSEFILLCDDDVLFSADSVQKLFDALLDESADCISPNVFPNHEMSFKRKLLNIAYYGTFPSFSRRWAFKIRRSSYYSYCNRPSVVMSSQSCAGPCILIKKNVNKSLNYNEELWLDSVPYTSGQDQVFAYKLFRYGYKMLIHYQSGVEHLDARTGHIRDEKLADYNKRFLRYIIWFRTIYLPDKGFYRILDILSFYSYWLWLLFLAALSYSMGRNTFKLSNSIKALSKARAFVHSEEFQKIPQWNIKVH